MPSNDTPPRPFVPKTEAERESVKQLCESAMRIGYAEGNGHIGSRKFQGVENEVDRLVPKVPRVKRVAALYGMFEATFRNVDGYGTAMFITHDSATGATGPQSFEDIVAEAPKALRTRIAAQLLDLIATPDEPAQPAAAQGGAWPMLNWEQWNEVRESYTHAARMHGDATAHEHAQHTMHALLGAVPVGRALTEDEERECWHQCYHVEGEAKSARVVIEHADALRGLAPTVTP